MISFMENFQSISIAMFQVTNLNLKLYIPNFIGVRKKYFFQIFLRCSLPLQFQIYKRYYQEIIKKAEGNFFTIGVQNSQERPQQT